VHAQVLVPRYLGNFCDVHRGACRYSGTVSVICIWFYQNLDFLADIYRTGQYRISWKSSFYQLISCIQTDKWMAGQNVTHIHLSIDWGCRHSWNQCDHHLLGKPYEPQHNQSLGHYVKPWPPRYEVGLLTTNPSVIICSDWPLDISCDLCCFKVDAVSRLCRVFCDHWVLPLEFGVSSGNGIYILANMYFSTW
jgi:hypothetical protein